MYVYNFIYFAIVTFDVGQHFTEYFIERSILLINDLLVTYFLTEIKNKGEEYRLTDIEYDPEPTG